MIVTCVVDEARRHLCQATMWTCGRPAGRIRVRDRFLIRPPDLVTACDGHCRERPAAGLRPIIRASCYRQALDWAQRDQNDSG